MTAGDDSIELQSGDQIDDAAESVNGADGAAPSLDGDDAPGDAAAAACPSSDEAPHGSSTVVSASDRHGSQSVLASPPPQAISLDVVETKLPAPEIVTGAGAPAAAPATDGAAPANAADLSAFAVNGTNAPTDPVSDTADQVVNGGSARSTYGVSGTGIKVGIISDSFNLDRTASTRRGRWRAPARRLRPYPQGRAERQRR